MHFEVKPGALSRLRVETLGNAHARPLSRSHALTLRRSRAMSLLETTIATAIGSLILTAVMALLLFSSRSFVAMGNYMDLDRASRNALDRMSRDIRQTMALQSYSTNKLVFTDFDTNTLTFAWDPATRQLTRTKSGVSTVLLSQCDYLNFHICQRNPIPGAFDFYSETNNASVGKLVDLSWRCSRTILGAKINTESVQTAKIVIRN